MAYKFNIKQEIFTHLTKDQEFATQAGMLAWSDYDKWFEALSALEKIDLTLAMVNNLERLDPMIDSIKYTTESAQVVEEYMVAKFSRGNWDVAGKAYKPILQDLNIPYEDYTCGVEISEKMAKKDERGTIARVLDAIVPAYQRLLRGLALQAVMYLPEDESRYTPCFWRDTSGFSNPKDKLVPHPNGLLKFTNSESHYLAESTYSIDMLKKLEKKIRSKGYGKTLVILASDSTWDEYEKVYTVDDLKRIQLIDMTSQFAPEEGRTTYVRMPDTDFPSGYFFAYDPTVSFLAHKVPSAEGLKGLQRVFSTFEEARTNHRANFILYENGMGVVEKGAGAVMYVGGSSYQNPDLNGIIA